MKILPHTGGVRQDRRKLARATCTICRQTRPIAPALVRHVGCGFGSQRLGVLFMPKDLARQVLSAACIDVSQDEAAVIRA